MATDFLYDDKTGDLVLNDGRPVMISGTEELSQAIRSLLTTPKGTVPDDEDLGMDMSFLVGGFDEDMAIEAASEAIMQDKRVTDLRDVSVIPDFEQGTVSFNLAYSSTVGDVGVDNPTNVEVKMDAIRG